MSDEVDPVVDRVWGNSKEWFLELRDEKDFDYQRGYGLLLRRWMLQSLSEFFSGWRSNASVGWCVLRKRTFGLVPRPS